MVLKNAPAELRADRDCVLVAIKQNSGAIEYVSEVLRSDHEFMLAVVMQKASALEFASDELRADRAIVLAALSSANNRMGLATSHAVVSSQSHFGQYFIR